MKLKKHEILFRPQGGSGPLSVYWYEGPYGDAIESLNGTGVGWFSPDGKLLGVEFDDVNQGADLQELRFKNGPTISVAVVDRKIDVKIKKDKLGSKKRGSVA